MLFSIVVPVYNVELYIDECLKSLLEQSFEDFEIILVDDGSTDSSGKKCDYYASIDSRVRVIHKNNEGLLLARRTGIRECRGEYILHCDSDDYVAGDMLYNLKILIENSKPDMILFGYNVVDDMHNVLETHYDVFGDNVFFSAENKDILLNALSSTTWLNNMVTKATRRECVDIDGDYNAYKNVKMGEDLFQVVPLIRKCDSFVYVAKPFYFYRYNPKGMSKNVDKSYLENYLVVAKRVYGLLKDEDVSEKMLINYYNRFTLDIYKYLLRFAKAGLGKDEFQKTYKTIKDNSIFKDALRRYGKWSIVNKFFGVIIRPSNYYMCRILSCTLFSKKL